MAETVGKIILSYDVSGKWDAVRSELWEMQYSSSTINLAAMRTYELPNTTMWHEQKTVSQAIEDLKSICVKLNISLEKAVAALTQEQVQYYKK